MKPCVQLQAKLPGVFTHIPSCSHGEPVKQIQLLKIRVNEKMRKKTRILKSKFRARSWSAETTDAKMNYDQKFLFNLFEL